ncbi:MAG: HAD family hydrolase [Holophagaceae bacterium]|nr:HAD family hydrolase [Holophagaceae bacterium]
MKLIVWDFDGTLADTRPLIVDGMESTLRALNKDEALLEKWLTCVGLPVEEGLRLTFGTNDEMEMDTILKIYRSYNWTGNSHLIRPFPGMKELVAELDSIGIKQAIATSKRYKALAPQLADFGWTNTFHPIVTPDRVTQPKPHPESLEVCLQSHTLQPQDALMIGDTLYDLYMAKSANVPSIGVSYGFATKEQLLEATPITIAGDVEELRKILLQQSN